MPLTDSMEVPAVPSIAAEDTFGLFTKSMAEGSRIKSSVEAPIKPVTSDVTRSANKAAKKARQRDTKYRPNNLLPAKTTLEKQVTFKKDPTDSMQLHTKSPPYGFEIKSSAAEATPQSSKEASSKSPR